WPCQAQRFSEASLTGCGTPIHNRRGFRVLTGPNVILALKVAVAAVTVLLLASLVALVRRNYRLHGRINLAFFVLTLTAVLGLELLIRVYDPGLFDYFDEDTRQV